MSGKCLQFVHNQYGSLTNPTEKLMTTLRPLDRTHHHLRSGTDIQSIFPDPIRPQILYHRQLDTINTENLQRLPLDPMQSYIFSGHISQPDTQLILPFSTKRIYQRGDLDFLPVLKGGDSYTVRLNEGLRFGGFPFHRRPRCGRLAPTPVLRRLHGRLTTRRVPPRRECSRPHSSHGRAGRRT